MRCGTPYGRDALVDVLDQVAALEQPARQVDGDRLGKAEGLLPDPGLARGLAQRPLRQRHDQAGVLGQRNEVARRHQLAAALPAHQRLGAHHARGAHVDLGLVVQHQFVALDGLVQRGLELELLAAAAGQLRAVDGRRHCLPCSLDRVHRHVGIAQQVDHRCSRRAGYSATPTLAVTKHSWPPTKIGSRSASSMRCGHALGVVLVGHFGQQGHELVAAQAAHGFQRAVRAHAGGFERAFHDLVAVAHAGAQAAAPLPSAASSPAAWPSVSLMILKRSRSISSSANWWPMRRACSSARSARQISWRRLGRPVRASKLASWRILSSATRRSVTSCNDAGVADAVAVFVELGLGLDVDDALAAVEQHRSGTSVATTEAWRSASCSRRRKPRRSSCGTMRSSVRRPTGSCGP